MAEAKASADERLEQEILGRMMAALPGGHEHPELTEFYRLLRDYPSRGGKMIRGRLLVHAAAAHGAEREVALSVASALELFQNWVLIHDDVEDDSDERRGAPSLHRRTGVPIAINVGDALHVYMWEMLHDLEAPPVASAAGPGGIPTGVAREIRGEFLHMIHRTAEGQHLDLAWVAGERFDIGEEDYLRMVVLKTSWYTVASPLRLGARCAGLAPSPALTEAGRNLGAAFQIRDDVLNLMPDTRGYGKEFAGDLYEGKRTLILAHLFAHASADERAELGARLGKPRADRTERDVAWLLSAIERRGSLGYAQERAEELARKGLAALRDGLADVPGADAARRVLQLMHTLTDRRA